jgi:hypothetical protein
LTAEPFWAWKVQSEPTRGLEANVEKLSNEANCPTKKFPHVMLDHMYDFSDLFSSCLRSVKGSSQEHFSHSVSYQHHI